MRVAIQVKHLMRALGGPHEYLGAASLKKPFSRGSIGDTEMFYLVSIDFLCRATPPATNA